MGYLQFSHARGAVLRSTDSIFSQFVVWYRCSLRAKPVFCDPHPGAGARIGIDGSTRVVPAIAEHTELLDVRIRESCYSSFHASPWASPVAVDLCHLLACGPGRCANDVPDG